MKWIFRFFVVLGVIFFVLIIGVVYFVVADPYNLRPLVTSLYTATTGEVSDDMASSTITDTETQTAHDSSSEDAGSLSENQVQALEAVGIDRDSVPAQFSPEQTACFVKILGQARVDAIVAGDTPTPAEFFQAKGCL
ncbi:MAG: hypothetical protein V4668_02625 [Patescibacteria group bacterium]